MIEPLEPRLLLSAAPRVTNVIADNRGLVDIYFDQQIDASTINTTSVAVYTAGQDGQLGTADDVKAPEAVSYGAGQQRIIINANIAANTPYWVAVRSGTVKGTNGLMVDGEYTGTLPSGDGQPGGNFRFDADIVPTNRQIARFTIAGQSFNVKLYNINHLAESIPNFLNYANSGSYDGTFIHRTTSVGADGFAVVQGGAFYISGNPVVSENAVPSQDDIATEPTFSNDIGTIAFANTGQPNSTGNQWYFNLSNNQTAFGANYSVFGAITNSSGLAALQTVYNTEAQNLDLTTTIDGNGNSRYGAYQVVGQLNSVPVTNGSVNAANANPATDFIIVSRVAIRNAVVPHQEGSTGVIVLPSAVLAVPLFSNGNVIGLPTAITNSTDAAKWNSALEIDHPPTLADVLK